MSGHYNSLLDYRRWKVWCVKKKYSKENSFMYHIIKGHFPSSNARLFNVLHIILFIWRCVAADNVLMRLRPCMIMYILVEIELRRGHSYQPDRQMLAWAFGGRTTIFTHLCQSQSGIPRKGMRRKQLLLYLPKLLLLRKVLRQLQDMGNQWVFSSLVRVK